MDGPAFSKYVEKAVCFQNLWKNLPRPEGATRGGIRVIFPSVLKHDSFVNIYIYIELYI